MKKILAVLLALMMVFSLVACEKAPAKDEGKEKEASAEADKAKDDKAADEKTEEKAADDKAVAEDEVPEDFHIGIVTGTISQTEDEQRGAEAMIELYGATEDGGRVTHLNYPDNYSQETETTIQQITSLADDPKMRVIVVNQGIPGTAAAFTQIREKRPEIVLLAGNSQEDTALIEGAADMVCDPDNVNRGYLIPLAAKKLGATKFVHVSFPRHMGIELLSLRRDIMEATCEKIGLEFYAETAPDPTTDIGTPGAQQFILENMPKWVEKYGKDTCFFATNDAHTEPMLLKVAELGAIFVEQDLPSPILGYPGAFGLDLKDVAGNWPEILKRVEEVAIEKGASGRMGTWAYSFGFTTTQALAEYGIQIVEGKAKKGNLEDLLKVYEKFTPGAEWNGSLFVDKNSKETKENHALVYQDDYIFGQGYLGITKEEIPDLYALLDEYKNK